MRTGYYYGKHKGRLKNIYRSWAYRWIVNKFMKKCNTILDIGSGSGLAYDVFVEKRKKVLGIDLDKKAIRDNIKLMDYRVINKHFDCFFASQIISHTNQFDLMETAKKYCDKIFVIISTKPCNSFWNSPDIIRPYTAKAVKSLLESYGFRVIFSMNLYPTKSFIVVGRKDK